MTAGYYTLYPLLASQKQSTRVTVGNTTGIFWRCPILSNRTVILQSSSETYSYTVTLTFTYVAGVTYAAGYFRCQISFAATGTSALTMKVISSYIANVGSSTAVYTLTNTSSTIYSAVGDIATYWSSVQTVYNTSALTTAQFHVDYTVGVGTNTTGVASTYAVKSVICSTTSGDDGLIEA